MVIDLSASGELSYEPGNPSIATRIPMLMHHERRVIAMRVFFLVVVALLVLALGGLEVIASHHLVAD